MIHEHWIVRSSIIRTKFQDSNLNIKNEEGEINKRINKSSKMFSTKCSFFKGAQPPKE